MNNNAGFLAAVYINDFVGEYCECEVWTTFHYPKYGKMPDHATISARILDPRGRLKDHPRECFKNVSLPISTSRMHDEMDDLAAHVLFPRYQDSFDYYAEYFCDATDKDTGDIAPAYQFVPYDMED